MEAAFVLDAKELKLKANHNTGMLILVLAFDAKELKLKANHNTLSASDIPDLDAKELKLKANHNGKIKVPDENKVDKELSYFKKALSHKLCK